MQARAACETRLKSVETDFLRLIDMDRESPEFEALYRRFDEALEEALELELALEAEEVVA